MAVIFSFGIKLVNWPVDVFHIKKKKILNFSIGSKSRKSKNSKRKSGLVN